MSAEASRQSANDPAILVRGLSHRYPRSAGAFPAGSPAGKYWPPVGRVDNVYGDRNLFCSCVPVSDEGREADPVAAQAA